MTLSGGTGAHPQHAEFIGGVIELRPVIVEDTQYEAQFQVYLQGLESAIRKIKEVYRLPLKDSKGKLTHKGQLIKNGEQLKRGLGVIESSGLAMALEESVFQEYRETARRMAIEILEAARSNTEFTVINHNTFIQETLENLRKQKILIIDLLGKIQEFCTKADELCISIQAKQNKGGNGDHRVTDIKQRVIASVESNIPPIGKKEAPKNGDRLPKLEARIHTLEKRLLEGKDLDLVELERMIENLSQMTELTTAELSKRDALVERIQVCKKGEVRIKDRENLEAQGIPTHEESEIEFNEDEQYILAIWKYILSENGVHGTLSSTKNNGHTTNWDGTFVVKTLRPFLSQLVHVVYERRKVDFENTSWSALIDIYEKSVENISPHIRLFISVLKGNKKIVSFKMILIELLGAVKEISKHDCFSAPSEKRLVNVQNKLKEIIDKFYPE